MNVASCSGPFSTTRSIALSGFPTSAPTAKRADRLGDETAIFVFGHFCAEAPKSLRRTSARIADSQPFAVPLRNPCKRPYLPPAGLEDGPDCHAEGRGFESLQPLFRECPARGRVTFGGSPKQNRSIPALRDRGRPCESSPNRRLPQPCYHAPARPAGAPRCSEPGAWESLWRLLRHGPVRFSPSGFGDRAGPRSWRSSATRNVASSLLKRQNASTTVASNWLPAPRRSSSSARVGRMAML